MSALPKSEIPGIETEYVAMRTEILERIKLRQQIIAITLVLCGALIGAGLNKPAVALIYPPFAAFLALAWGQNDYRIRDLAGYIREKICPKVPAFGWESHMKEIRDKALSQWRYIVLSHGGIFLFTTLLSTVVGGLGVLGTRHMELIELRLICALAALDAVAIVGVLYIVLEADGTLPLRKGQKPEPSAEKQAGQ